MQRGTFSDLQRVASVHVGNRTVAGTLLQDIGSDDRHALLVANHTRDGLPVLLRPRNLPCRTPLRPGDDNHLPFDFEVQPLVEDGRQHFFQRRILETLVDELRFVHFTFLVNH